MVVSVRLYVATFHLQKEPNKSNQSVESEVRRVVSFTGRMVTKRGSGGDSECCNVSYLALGDGFW